RDEAAPGIELGVEVVAADAALEIDVHPEVGALALVRLHVSVLVVPLIRLGGREGIGVASRELDRTAVRAVGAAVGIDPVLHAFEAARDLGVAVAVLFEIGRAITLGDVQDHVGIGEGYQIAVAGRRCRFLGIWGLRAGCLGSRRRGIGWCHGCLRRAGGCR